MPKPAPLGDYNDTQRTCSRLLSHREDGSEALCGRRAVQHVIYWWKDAGASENPDDCWDHGYACAEHFTEFGTAFAAPAASHDLGGACGMPGSTYVHADNVCVFHDLPVAEPVRVVAVAVASTASEPRDA